MNSISKLLAVFGLVTVLLVSGAMVAETTRAQMKYTTPSLGTVYHLSDLASASMGVVTGSSPNFYIHGDLTINWADTLEVMAGETLNFDPESNLSIKGTLKAVGTSDSQRDIRFTYNASIGEAWNGIVFEDTSKDDACKLRYCQISKAITGVKCISSSPKVENCTITDCSRSGIDLWSAEGRIYNTTLNNNNNYGVFIDDSSRADVDSCQIKGNGVGIRVISDNVTVRGCQVVNNKNDGIDTYQSAAQILGNNISGNYARGIFAMNSDLTIIENKINENQIDGLWINANKLNASLKTIMKDNDIQGNLQCGIIAVASNIEMSGNSIKNNDQEGIYCRNSTLRMSADTLLYNGWHNYGVSWNYSGIFCAGSEIEMDRCQVSNSAYAGIEMEGSTCYAQNSSIRTSQYYDLHLDQSSTATLVNTSFGADAAKAAKIVGSGSKIYVWWYLDLQFVDEATKESLDGAHVEIGPKSYAFGGDPDDAYFYGLSDQQGRVSKVICMEKIYSGSSISSQVPVMAYVQDGAHGLHWYPINLTSYQHLVIEVGQKYVRPEVFLINLEDNETLNHTTIINGYAIPSSVISVEYRIDAGAWMLADGTAFFNITLDPQDLMNGPHEFSIRAFDGINHSDVKSLRFVTNVVAKDTDGDRLSDAEEQHLGTDPTKPDTDSDSLFDGIEVDDSDGNTTNPLDPDTDGDDILDGIEDMNHNGRVDTGETDPNDPKDPVQPDDDDSVEMNPSTILIIILILVIAITLIAVLIGLWYRSRPPEDEDGQTELRVSMNKVKPETGGKRGQTTQKGAAKGARTNTRSKPATTSARPKPGERKPSKTQNTPSKGKK